MLTVAIPKRNKLQNIIVLTPKDGGRGGQRLSASGKGASRGSRRETPRAVLGSRLQDGAGRGSGKDAGRDAGGRRLGSDRFDNLTEKLR